MPIQYKTFNKQNKNEINNVNEDRVGNFLYLLQIRALNKVRNIPVKFLLDRLQ